ncbi:hypothetical protein RRG08_067259 [Elysia crispata]|uniref:G-protein coupled receptors family 1 profile domain-containing protein n=1 Tax=Elysia crispata TaxID=231223 RepID=A0AAE0XPW7_9GAST|nr:hypothetical protein RRG08_067259 [Elysia crispata]
MDQDLNCNHGGSGTNGTSSGFVDRGNKWIESLENVYGNICAVYSWGLVGTGVLGVIGNILIVLVYTTMGFSNTINISYTALAVSDLCCVLACVVYGAALIWIPVQQMPCSQTYQQYGRLFGGYPYLAFSRVTALLTAWISLERCLCVILPARIKLMITHTVTKLALITIFMLACFPLVCLYLAYTSESQFDPNMNVTIKTVLYDGGVGQSVLQKVALFLFGVVYPTSSGVSVTVCTAVLVVTLKQSTRWRNLNASGGSTSSTDAKNGSTSESSHIMSTRDVRVTRVVVIVTSVFLVCSLPTIGQLVANSVFQDYSATGYFTYLYHINGMVAVWVTQLNSSLNIIIFTVSGQRFRATLLQVLAGRFRARP